LDYLLCHIEALIFCAASPLKPGDIRSCLMEMFEADIPLEDIEDAIGRLMQKYENDVFAIHIVNTGGGFQFLTKPAYQASIGILLKQQSRKRLSASALETLSIIAYKQPTTRPQIELIRGVNCEYTIQRLLEKELIELKGKSDSLGRPLLYGTTIKFMDYFGIKSLEDLPALKEFKEEENQIGKELQ
jgi:segregation and condensation protein B